MNPRHTTAFGRVFGGQTKPGDRRAGSRKPNRPKAGACEALEGRVVLSHWGGPPPDFAIADGTLMTTLSEVGVVSLPGPGGMSGPGFIGKFDIAVAASAAVSTEVEAVTETAAETEESPFDLLNKETKQLRTDLEGLAAKSEVTIGGLTSLASDARAIAESGFHPDAAALKEAVTAVATAVAGGADTTQAQADFKAVFADSEIDQTVIDKAYADLVKTVEDSNVTTEDLQTIADDRKAIETAMTNLRESAETVTPGGFGGDHVFSFAATGEPAAFTVSDWGGGGPMNFAPGGPVNFTLGEPGGGGGGMNFTKPVLTRMMMADPSEAGMPFDVEAPPELLAATSGLSSDAVPYGNAVAYKFDGGLAAHGEPVSIRTASAGPVRNDGILMLRGGGPARNIDSLNVNMPWLKGQALGQSNAVALNANGGATSDNAVKPVKEAAVTTLNNNATNKTLRKTNANGVVARPLAFRTGAGAAQGATQNTRFGTNGFANRAFTRRWR